MPQRNHCTTFTSIPVLQRFPASRILLYAGDHLLPHVHGFALLLCVCELPTARKQFIAQLGAAMPDVELITFDATDPGQDLLENLAAHVTDPFSAEERDERLRELRSRIAAVAGATDEVIVRQRLAWWDEVAELEKLHGELDEALRIHEQEELPVLERLGDVQSLLVARANLAINLLQRAAPGDRERARELLTLALADARRLGIPEAGQIEAIMQQHKLQPEA